VVKDRAEESDVDSVIRQHRILIGAADDGDVRVTASRRLHAQRVDLRVGDLDGVDVALRADGVGEQEDEVAVAGADVGDGRARLELERRHHTIRLAPARRREELVESAAAE